VFCHCRDEVSRCLPTENNHEDLSKELVILQQQIELLKETLRQEISAREMLRQRVMQQDGQIRELQRTTHGILHSRIWKTMVRVGGAVLGFDQRLSFLQRRFQNSLGKTGSESIVIHRDSPGVNSPPVSEKVKFQGWAIAESGIAKVEVGIGGKLVSATTGLKRPDVGEMYPQFPGSGESGYRVVVDISHMAAGFHTVTLYATSVRGVTAETEFSIEVRHGADLRKRSRRENELLLGAMRRKPVISVLVPVYDTPEIWLRHCIDSVLKQQYPHWELCLVDDCSRAPHVRRILEEYRQADTRVNVLYRSENGHIAKATNSALEIATGEFIALLDHDDELTEDALFEVAIAHNENPAADWIYSDEDKIDEEGFCSDPFYKPDWSPEYFLTCMYTCHLGVYRTELVRSIGGFRPEVNGAQDYDLALRLAARETVVYHIPKVLYHWRTLATSTASGGDAKDYAYPAAQRALANYLKEAGVSGEVLPGPRHGFHRIRFDIVGQPKVSIVIPSAARIVEHEGERIDLLRMCVGSILERSTYRNLEIVVVENGDLRPELKDWLSGKVRLVTYEAERFNLSEKMNLGALHATGDHVVLLNDDIEVISPDWIQQMLQYSQQPGIGAVGAKLLFPNRRIQHAGVVLLNGSPGHPYYNHPPEEIGYYLTVLLARNCIAVTGACTMTRAAVFREVGGYSVDFPLNYNDVDYGLKLREKGYRTVYVPEAELLHYESVSKEGAGGVRPGELDKFRRKWGERYTVDPYYNPNLPQDYPYYYAE
jgi:O-antigen biosynthesis protein